MRIEPRRLGFSLVSLAVSLMLSVPTALLLSSTLAAALFGGVCLISFLLFVNRFQIQMARRRPMRSPIILGVIIGLVLQAGGWFPFAGGAAVILFAGGGALLAMLMSPFAKAANP
jgi:hypothetical protein